jgi:D-lactate dehydrogenase
VSHRGGALSAREVPSRNFRVALRNRRVVPSPSVVELLCAVIIYFVETEPGDQDIYARGLPGHDVRFVATLAEVGDDAEVLAPFIGGKVSDEFLAAHPRLRFIATRSTATDHLDLPACRARGVIVAHVPFHAETTVAEHTFALLLALSRRLREVMLAPKGGRFSYEAARGFELAGKTLGIIGMGHIGQRVARLAQAFEMRVLAHDVEQPAEVAAALGFTYVPLDELLAHAEIISLHAPLTPATFHLINRDTLAKCRRGVFIINTARGSLIDTAALREALDSGQVGGAGLDVLEDERLMRAPAAKIIAADIVAHLRSDAVASEARDADRMRELEDLMLGDAILARPNVVCTPHVAFNSLDAVGRLQQMTVENIASFAAGRRPHLVS